MFLKVLDPKKHVFFSLKIMGYIKYQKLKMTVLGGFPLK